VARAEPRPPARHLTLVHSAALPWLAAPRLEVCAAGT
jgi:hypothetical protein